MGNGALPNGPSYRAHPRLYLLRHAGAQERCLFMGVERKSSAVSQTVAFDPYRTLDLFQILSRMSRWRRHVSRRSGVRPVMMYKRRGAFRAMPMSCKPTRFRLAIGGSWLHSFLALFLNSD